MIHNQIKIAAILSLSVLCACATPTVGTEATAQTVSTGSSHTPESRNTGFAAWKSDFISRAVQKGYNRTFVTRLIEPAKLNTTALDRDTSQPEFTNPIWTYVDNAANADRLNTGRRKMAELSGSFAAIESAYGVPKEVLTAIWGLESAYGKIQGNHDIIGALATLAYEGRRREFFESQLFAVLDILQSGAVRTDQLKGSWAGAMGMTQFIPTTFKDYAVDFNRDGNKDLWGSSDDALGSAAHYLSRHGWVAGQAVMIEVSLPQGFDYSVADGRKKTLKDWVALGVRPYQSNVFAGVSGNPDAKLLVPAGHRGPKFLTLKNYDVIKRYNNSTSYALGITSLAEAMAGRAAIKQAWPRQDTMLSRTEKKNLQARLTQLGFDTKGVDGQIGPNSRRAIRAWQRANGVVADGYVEKALYRRIMGS